MKVWAGMTYKKTDAFKKASARVRARKHILARKHNKSKSSQTKAKTKASGEFKRKRKLKSKHTTPPTDGSFAKGAARSRPRAFIRGLNKSQTFNKDKYAVVTRHFDRLTPNDFINWLFDPKNKEYKDVFEELKGLILDQSFQKFFKSQNNGTSDKLYFNSIIFLVSMGARPSDRNLQKILMNSNKGMGQFFFEQGYGLSEDVIKDTNVSKENLGIFQAWIKCQQLIEDHYEMSYVLGKDLKSTHDIENPPETSTMSGQYAAFFVSGDDVYWQAARAGKFCDLLDVYIREKRRFPMAALTNEKNDLRLIDLLSFSEEDAIWDKLLDPNLWVGRKDKLTAFFTDVMPLRHSGCYDLNDVLSKVDNAVYKQAASQKPRVRRRPKA